VSWDYLLPIRKDRVNMSGTKHDEGKPDLTLLNYSFLSQVSEAMMFGAKKYGRDNYRSGISNVRILGAVLRHAYKYLNGQDTDEESGIHHLAHAAAGINMFFGIEDAGTAEDVRPEDRVATTLADKFNLKTIRKEQENRRNQVRDILAQKVQK